MWGILKSIPHTSEKGEMRMKLYIVTYGEWNSTFSDLISRRMLSVGKDAEEAIANAEAEAGRNTRDFSAEEVKEIMGHEIAVR